MRKTIFLIFTLCAIFSLKAQSPNKAEQLLTRVSNKVQSYENILIDFRYTLENPNENATRETRGNVSLKGEKYVLNIMGTTRLFDGENMYTIIPADEEIVISTYNPENDQNITPSKMFTFYNEGYTSEMDVVQNVNGRKIQYVKLTPKDPDTGIKNILLGIDQQTKHIYNLIQTQNNGAKMTITVTSFKTDQPISKTLFEFKEERYEDYYINRLN